MEIAREHVRTEVLHYLERPVLSPAPVVIEIDSLLDNFQRKAVFIEFLFLQPIRKAGIVCIIRLETTRTGNHAQQTGQQGKGDISCALFHLHLSPLESKFNIQSQAAGGRHTEHVHALVIILR